MSEVLTSTRRRAIGSRTFVVRHRTLALAVAAVLAASASHASAADGTWVNPLAASWDDLASWNGGVVADGVNANALFNTIDIVGPISITLDTARTVGHISFGDTDASSAGSWTVAGPQALTLDGTVPSIDVSGLEATSTATISAQVITSAAGFTKTGSGTLILSSTANVGTGPIVVSGGTLIGGNTTSFTNVGLGNASSITLMNGTTLRSAITNTNTWVLGDGTNAVAPTQSLVIPTGNSATLVTPSNIRFNSIVSGGGTLNWTVNTANSRTDLQNTWTGFTGTLNLTGSGNIRLGINRLSSTQPAFNAGSWASTTIDLGGSVVFSPSTNSGGNTILIGSLSGSSVTAALGAGTAGSPTYQVGALNQSTTFSGGILGNATLTKVGTGRLTLNGTALSYTNPTNINAGEVRFDGAKTGAGQVNVNSGGTLSGSAAITGTTVVNSNGTLAPGSPVANNTMSFATGLTLNSGSNLTYEFVSSSNYDTVTVNALTLSGNSNLNLLNDGLATVYSTPGTYNLISYTTLTGAGLPVISTGSNDPTKLYSISTTTAPGSGLAGTLTLSITSNPNAPVYWNVDANGSWTTGANWVGGVAPNGAQRFAGLGGGGTPITAPRTVTLTANQTVGTLLISNSAAAFTLAASGSGSLTLDNAGSLAPVTISAGSHAISAPIVLTAGGAGFTVVNPGDTLTLTGAISGPAGITTGGSGTILLSGGHSYTGATTVSAGTVKLAVTNAIPTGSSLFAGGTVDLNGHDQTVAGLNGGGTITNSGAVNSVLAVSGAGVFGGQISNGATNTTALVKNGAGLLDISAGARTYSGGTTVNGGTLAITNTASLGTGGVNVNNGGALTVTGVTAFASTVTLALSGNATINGEGAGILGFAGPITGSGTFNLASTAVPKSIDFTGTATNSYTGTIVLNGNIALRLSTANASNSTAGWNLTNTAGIGSNIAADTTFPLASLAGTAGTILRGHQSSAGGAITTWQIGALNVSTTFSGAVVDGNSGTVDRPTVISKVGSGTQTFGGDVDTYTGATNVNAGTLVIDNDYTPTQQGTVVVGATPSTVLTIASGATATITTGHTALFYDVSNSGTLNVAGTLGYQTADGVVKSISQLTPGGGLLSSRGRLNVANTVTSVGALSATENGIVALQGGLKVTSLDAGSGRVFLSTSSTAPLVVDYTGGSSLPTVQGYILSGHGTTLLGGLYDYVSLSGLSSETLGATNASAGFNKYAIAAIDNTDVDTYNAIPGGASYGTFGGVGVDASSVLIRYTYAGDANLDGVISSLDYALINAGFAGTIPASKGWIAGDFNFDGAIDASDYAIIDFGYLTGGNVPLAFGDPISVPEPGSLSLLGLGAAAIMGRRRRQA